MFKLQCFLFRAGEQEVLILDEDQSLLRGWGSAPGGSTTAWLRICTRRVNYSLVEDLYQEEEVYYSLAEVLYQEEVYCSVAEDLNQHWNCLLDVELYWIGAS